MGLEGATVQSEAEQDVVLSSWEEEKRKRRRLVIG